MDLEQFSTPYRVHLGCGSMKFDGFVNVDTRQTEATDLVRDCSTMSAFPDNSASLIFSHAFFEHLYLLQRVPLLRDIHRVLQADGCVFFCGLPDFEVIARCYLEKAVGNVSPVFNLFEVYRYTHGLPEHQPDWWLEQLHKTLFDKDELVSMLHEAGFAQPKIFRYAFKTEPHKVNLAFVAAKNGAAIPEDYLMALVKMFAPVIGENPIDILT